MLRSLQCEISCNSITMPNNVVELLYYIKTHGRHHLEGRKTCYLPGFTGLKECRFNLFYHNLRLILYDCLMGLLALGAHE